MKYLNLIPIFLAFLIGPGVKAIDFVEAKNIKCKLFINKNLEKYSIQWHGGCKDGFADGLGVVKYLKKGNVDSSFFGILKLGYWDLGVHDTSEGFIAGHFKNNKLDVVKDKDGAEDRNTIIHSFESAAKASEQLSLEFEKLGNKASSKFYKEKSEKFKNQMD
jgi:hypothetical protein